MTHRLPLILPLTLFATTGLIACATDSARLDPAVPDIRMADRLVWSEAPTLVATGLVPDALYTLETEKISHWSPKASERSTLTYRANADGRIDTAAQAPEGMGDERDAVRPYLPLREMDYEADRTLDDLDPHRLRLTLSDSDGERQASRIVALGPDRTALVETALGDGFPGAFVLARSDQAVPAPAIVVLGGSEGGDSGSRSIAPELAAEGYVVLGLPYYSPAWGQDAQFPDLPSAFANIPVDYLEEAVTALRSRPDVDPDHISLFGVSKGAEFVLLAGSLIPDDSAGGGFCGIIADVPSDVVWEGWGAGETVSSFSWRGEALPFVPYTDMSRAFDREDSYTMTDAHENGRRDHPERAEVARIRVETIDEPVLVIGGDQDTTWASGSMARTITATRDAAGLETESYVYAEASHGVGGTPLVRTRAANLDARLENYPATMTFLERAATRQDCRE